jgi:hypothetical protein
MAQDGFIFDRDLQSLVSAISLRKNGLLMSDMIRVFAVTVMLILAATSHRFHQVTENIDHHVALALKLLQRWAFNGSAIESMHYLLSTARQRLRGRQAQSQTMPK